MRGGRGRGGAREPEAARHRARGHAPRSAGRAGRRHRGGAAAAGRALPRRRGGDQPTHRRARGGDPRGARGARGRDAGEPPRPALSPLDPRRARDRRRARPLPRSRPRAALGGARAARAARRAAPRGAAPRARPREDAEGPPLAPSPALRDRGAGKPTHGGARRARAAARSPRALLRPRARRGRAPTRALARAQRHGLRRVGGARPRRLGLPAWRRRQETPAEWARRIAMAADFLAGFEHALGRPPITRPAVRSLAPRAWRPLAPRCVRR